MEKDNQIQAADSATSVSDDLLRRLCVDAATCEAIIPILRKREAQRAADALKAAHERGQETEDELDRLEADDI